MIIIKKVEIGDVVSLKCNNSAEKVYHLFDGESKTYYATLSPNSVLGKAITGKSAGETVTVGSLNYQILDIIEKNYDTTSIYDYLVKRRVPYLIHFTPVDNLKSILEKGIVPVNDFVDSDIDINTVIRPDEDRPEGQTDGSCFSISFPNYRMRFQKEREDSITFAILEIDLKALSGIPSEKILLYKGNAATKSGIDNRVFTIRDLFQEHYHDEKRKIDIERKSLCIPDCYTTDPQAELIIAKKIDQKYIRKIYIKSRNDVDINDARIIVNPIIFNGRKDYEFWKSCNDIDNMEVIANGDETDLLPF